MALWKVTGLLVSDGIGTPPVVIVTVMKPEGHTQRYMDTIKENREQYAKKHGTPPTSNFVIAKMS